MSHAAPIIIAEPIDVAGWCEDDEFARYPEGARPKSAYFPPKNGVPDFIVPSRRYLFKRSARRYPEQFWAEIAAYHIGCLLGVDVPLAVPAVHGSKGQCGALIQWFYEDAGALYVPGGAFMQQAIPDFDREHGWQHNFHTIRVIFRAFHRSSFVLGDWLSDWGRIFVFDALCGNTDRHQDNWGIVAEMGADGMLHGRLSPAFDNGTSLGNELSEAHQGKWTAADLRRYVDRGMHHMKWHINDGDRLKHVDGAQRVVAMAPQSCNEMLPFLERFNHQQLRENLLRLSEIEMPTPLSKWRVDLICHLVRMRHELLVEALG